MKAAAANPGFTLAEAMIALAGSSIIMGALLFSSMTLQKCLHSAEQFAANQSDQRRLLDYVARDLRRAIGVGTTSSVGALNGTPLNGATVAIDNSTSLMVTIPGYYASQTPDTAAYSEALGIVAADNYVDYGSNGVHAPGVSVVFRKQYDPVQQCNCFVRVEADTETVIVPDADNLQLQLTVSPDGQSCSVIATFASPYSHGAPPVSEREDVLLRNVRTD